MASRAASVENTLKSVQQQIKQGNQDHELRRERFRAANERVGVKRQLQDVHEEVRGLHSSLAAIGRRQQGHEERMRAHFTMRIDVAEAEAMGQARGERIGWARRAQHDDRWDQTVRDDLSDRVYYYELPRYLMPIQVL